MNRGNRDLAGNHSCTGPIAGHILVPPRHLSNTERQEKLIRFGDPIPFNRLAPVIFHLLIGKVIRLDFVISAGDLPGLPQEMERFVGQDPYDTLVDRLDPRAPQHAVPLTASSRVMDILPSTRASARPGKRPVLAGIKGRLAGQNVTRKRTRGLATDPKRRPAVGGVPAPSIDALIVAPPLIDPDPLDTRRVIGVEKASGPAETTIRMTTLQLNDPTHSSARLSDEDGLRLSAGEVARSRNSMHLKTATSGEFGYVGS